MMHKQVDKSILPDITIIERITGGETDLFEILIRRYNSHLYKVGRAYGYNHEDTQDLMQETFIGAFQNLQRFEQRSSLRTWLIRIMLNNCFQKRNKASTRNEKPQAFPVNETTIPAYTDPRQTDTMETIVNGELARIIEMALAKVSEEYRIVFALREINGLDVKETAHLLNITESNVKVRLHRAKSLLRKSIETHYSPEELFEFNAVYCDAMVLRVMSALHGHGINALGPTP
jgi:RNA polymerase sigma factor (sigma-70 family)